MRKSIFMILLCLISAVPAFAVDGVLSGAIFNDRVYGKAIYEKKVVFSAPQTGDIVLYDIEKGGSTVLGQGGYPQIYANTVVWVDSNLQGDIVKYDILTGVKVQLTTEGGHNGDSRPWLHGNKVVWTNNSIYIADGYPVIVVHDIFTGQTTPLSVIGWRCHIYGDKFVYTRGANSGDWNEVYLYDLKTGTNSLITTSNDYGKEPMIDSRNVYWIENNTMKIYSIATGSIEAVTLEHSPTNSPSAFDGKVYVDYHVSAIGTYKVLQYDTKNKILSVLNTPPNVYQEMPVVYENTVVLTNGPVSGGVRDTRVFTITAPAQEVYSLNAGGSSVTVINPYDGHVSGTITTGAGPSAAGLSADGTALFVLNSTDKTVSVAQTYDFAASGLPVNINPGSNYIPTAVSGEYDWANNTYKTIYVAMKNKNSQTNGVVRKIMSSDPNNPQDLQVGKVPNSLKMSPDGNTLYVSNEGSGTVTAIDVAPGSFAVKSTISTGAAPKLIKP